MNELIPINQAYEQMILSEVKPYYRREAKRFLPIAYAAGGMTPDTMKHLVSVLETEGKSVSTINKHISAMRYVIRKAYKVTHMAPALQFEFEQKLKEIKFHNISAGDRRIKADKVLSEPDYLAMVEAASGRIALILEFLWMTGTRITEALTVRLDNCTESQDIVSVRVKGKGDVERTVRISKDLFNRILHRFRGTVYLLESSRTPGKRLDDRGVATQIRDLGKKVLGRTIGPHTLRHSFATRMIADGMDVKAVSEYLGHSTSAITLDMYVHTSLSNEDLGIVS